MNIGVLLPNWIGDVVMATPTLRALRDHYGADAHITGVLRPYVKQVLAGTTWLDRSIIYDRKSSDPQRRTWAVVKQLRAAQLDTVVLLPNSLRAGVLGWLSGARRRVGYGRYGRGPLLNVKLQPSRDGRKLKPVSAIDYYLELAYAVGCPPQSQQLELATLPEDERGADLVWENLQLHGQRVVVLNTGGARGAAKHWPTEYFVELAQRIVSDFADATVLVICGPAEREVAAEIGQRADHRRVTSMAEQDLSLGVAKACIRRSHLMVTTDSGPRHFAPAFDVPVIALFGPIDYRWSETYHPQAVHLQHDVPCGPCGRRMCPFEHHRCMRDLSVGRVYREVVRQLEPDVTEAA